jgi:hypothetical protein
MLRNSAITTRSGLATTTLVGVIAIAQAAALHRRIASEPHQSQDVSVVQGVGSSCNVASYPVQLAVLLEGFASHPLIGSNPLEPVWTARQPSF